MMAMVRHLVNPGRAQSVVVKAAETSEGSTRSVEARSAEPPRYSQLPAAPPLWREPTLISRMRAERWPRVSQRVGLTHDGYLLLLARASALLAIAFGALLAYYMRDTWQIDGLHNLEVARRLLAGADLYDGWYLYPPLAAILTVPLALLPTESALLLLLIIKVILVVGGAWWISRGRPLVDQLLLIGLGLSFVGILHDIRLGNTNILILAAVVVLAWTPDAAVRGIPLGIALVGRIARR